MTVTPPEPLPEDPLRERLAAFVKAPDTDDPFLQDCTNEARALVTEAADATGGRRRQGTEYLALPGDVFDRAVLEVAADLYHRRQTRLGVAGFADTDLNPIRIPRDPLAAARGFLAPYLKGGFA